MGIAFVGMQVGWRCYGVSSGLDSFGYKRKEQLHFSARSVEHYMILAHCGIDY